MSAHYSVPTSTMNEDQPISRTYQYRKVMKPMLERKRRARINRCLDEMKELMSSTLASQGEHISKLEKADVLELTVRHLQKLKQAQNNNSIAGSANDKYCAGFSQCAVEVRNFLVSVPGIDINVGRRLLTHLGRCAQRMQVSGSAGTSSYTPPCSPKTPTMSPAFCEHDQADLLKCLKKNEAVAVGDNGQVWRPW